VFDEVQLEIAVETGKMAFAPFLRPCEGPMAEYCLHLAAPAGRHSVWVHSEQRLTPKGLRHRVKQVLFATGTAPPTPKAFLVAELNFSNRLMVLGDLTFIHSREALENRQGSVYSRGMSVIRQRANLGGLYLLDDRSSAVSVRVGLKEARLPVKLSLRDGVVYQAVIDVDPAYVMDDLGGEEDTVA
jgi:hypothetical protein